VPLDYEKILNWRFDDVVQSYVPKDCILYALGIGLGLDPLDADDLKFVYEKNLQTFPTLALILGYPGPWMADPETGIDMLKVLHAEQSLDIVKPLPKEGTIRGKVKVVEIIDKGKDKGALIVVERKIVDDKTRDLYCIQRSTAFARGNGGFDGPVSHSKKPQPIPDSSPHVSIEMPTSTQSALLYRLSGDYNILHADPAVAKKAGFRAPILHGLASFGVAAHSLMKALNVEDSTRLKHFSLRFSAPVYPGETLRTEAWADGETLAFRTTAVERDVVVLNNGRAIIESDERSC
jgi:acyl dehydratase